MNSTCHKRRLLRETPEPHNPPETFSVLVSKNLKKRVKRLSRCTEDGLGNGVTQAIPSILSSCKLAKRTVPSVCWPLRNSTFSKHFDAIGRGTDLSAPPVPRFSSPLDIWYTSGPFVPRPGLSIRTRVNPHVLGSSRKSVSRINK